MFDQDFGRAEQVSSKDHGVERLLFWKKANRKVMMNATMQLGHYQWEKQHKKKRDQPTSAIT